MPAACGRKELRAASSSSSDKRAPCPPCCPRRAQVQPHGLVDHRAPDEPSGSLSPRASESESPAALGHGGAIGSVVALPTGPGPGAGPAVRVGARAIQQQAGHRLAELPEGGTGRGGPEDPRLPMSTGRLRVGGLGSCRRCRSMSTVTQPAPPCMTVLWYCPGLLVILSSLNLSLQWVRTGPPSRGGRVPVPSG